MELRNKLLTFFILVANLVFAQDIIVKKDGRIIEVYNMEEGSSSIFYSLEPSTEATIFKISKDDVFSVKKKDENQPHQIKDSSHTVNNHIMAKHEVITALLSSEITNDNTGRTFAARTQDGHELNYVVLSETDHTLAVIKGEYQEQEYIIPEYVQVGTDIYTVTEIAPRAFFYEITISNITFPQTLKKIGKEAFNKCGLECIILPEGLEELGESSFANAGTIGWTSKKKTIREIYLPSSVKKIGEKCFWHCGADLSPNGYCQALFTNLPNFITEDNCKRFGIDDNPVQALFERKKLEGQTR